MGVGQYLQGLTYNLIFVPGQRNSHKVPIKHLKTQTHAHFRLRGLHPARPPLSTKLPFFW